MYDIVLPKMNGRIGLLHVVIHVDTLAACAYMQAIIIIALQPSLRNTVNVTCINIMYA